MNYTDIPDWYEPIYLDKFKYGTGDYPSFSMKFARSDPVVFGYYMISPETTKMRIYQSYILDCITAPLIKRLSIKFPGKFYFNPKLQEVIDHVGHDCKKFIMTISRQAGKSTVLKLLVLWMAYFNISPSGTSNETKCFIVSRGDDQAKELLSGIRSMIRQGDMTMARVTKTTKLHDVNWLSRKMVEPNNTQQITFDNAFGAKSFIKSVPPTDAIIGKSSDILIIDEAAKLGCNDPDNWFNEAADPTTLATDGITILSSTPNGQAGLFYNLFDPEDRQSVHQYFRIWFPFTICREESYLRKAEENKQRLLSEGKRKEWEQEYEAKFTTAVASFFDSDSVDDSFDKSLCEVYSDDGPTSIGVDYGMVNSQTVLTVSKGLTMLRQHAYEKGDEGLTWFDDICKMVDDFKCDKIVVDSCPEGFMINNRLIQKYGEYPQGKVVPVVFRAIKVSMFDGFRKNLTEGKIKLFNNDALKIQMKGMRVEQLKTNISISKGSGMMDDRVDSLVMSMYPKINNEPTQESGLNYGDPYECIDAPQRKEYRGDTQWEELQKKQTEHAATLQRLMKEL